eukprot:11704636-Ditylum_brightwellii.AAC.1
MFPNKLPQILDPALCSKEGPFSKIYRKEASRLINFKHKTLITNPESETEDGVGQGVSHPDSYFTYSIFGSGVLEVETKEGCWRKEHGIMEGLFHPHD